jgi:hypothetical protein
MGGAGAPPWLTDPGYEHQYPVEFGLTLKQVFELGFVVVPQALHRQ